MMLPIRRVLVTGTALLAAAGMLAACSASPSAPTDSPTTVSGGTLTLADPLPVSTFAVKDSAWANESPYLQAVYDTLLRADPDGTVIPWLATKWSYDDTRTVLTMTLRSDVTFTDGTKFDATVAVQNLLRFRDGASPQKGYLASLRDAVAVDPTTLKLTLSEPNPSLLSFLSQNPGLMESPKNFDTPDEKTTPVGSGPYVLDAADTVIGSTYVFTKNEHYWAPADRHYDKIVLNVYATPTAVVNAIMGGQVNGATISDTSTVDQVKAAGFETQTTEASFYGLLLLDRAGRTEKALADVRVRQAINYAFDKDAMLKAVGHGYGSVTSQMFGVTSDGFNKSLDTYYGYDPAKAKQLLQEAGYAPGSITLTQPQYPGYPPAVYALAKQYLEAVGIKVNYVAVSNADFLPSVLAAKYGTVILNLKAAPTAWESMSLELLPKAVWNPFHYEDPAIDALAKQIQNGAPAESAAAAKQVNDYIVKQAWFATWYRKQGIYATDGKTTVKLQQDSAYPYLWNFQPKP